VHADEVARGERLRKGQQFHPGHVPRAAVPADDPHTEGRSATGDGLADGTEADQAQGRTGEIPAQEEVRRPGVLRPPVAPAHPGIGLGDAPRRGEEQGKGRIGGGIHQHARRVPDGDAPRRGRRQVHVIEADGDTADETQPRCGVEQRRVDAVREQADEPVRGRDFGAQRPGRQQARARPARHVAVLAKFGDALARQLVRNIDVRQGFLPSPAARNPHRGRRSKQG